MLEGWEWGSGYVRCVVEHWRLFCQIKCRTCDARAMPAARASLAAREADRTALEPASRQAKHCSCSIRATIRHSQLFPLTCPKPHHDSLQSLHGLGQLLVRCHLSLRPVPTVGSRTIHVLTYRDQSVRMRIIEPGRSSILTTTLGFRTDRHLVTDGVVRNRYVQLHMAFPCGLSFLTCSAHLPFHKQISPSPLPVLPWLNGKYNAARSFAGSMCIRTRSPELQCHARDPFPSRT